VITPIVLIPFGSTCLAIYKPSEVVISTLAGSTQRMIVLESLTYLLAIALVIYSMLSGWSDPAIGIRVIPGRSKCKIRTGWWINMECNGLIDNVFTLTTYFIC
jgi:hypothetical protein